MPGVAGVDLDQALNFISVADVGIDFCYERYTSSRLPYRPGSRPVIEEVARTITRDAPDDRAAALLLNEWVCTKVAWAGHHRAGRGSRLASDLALPEEAIIEQGYGWCNEQARVLCCLTQAVGIPSRLVFASNAGGDYGHCTTEVMLRSGWMMLDQSLGFTFERDHQPVRAVDVWGDPAHRSHFGPIYKEMCMDLVRAIGTAAAREDFLMALAPDPLDGFAAIGFHNHFLI